MNLIGVELFCPSLVCTYREIMYPDDCPSYKRLTDTQCKLFISLLKRNKSPVIRERILENILIPEIQTMFDTPYRAEPSLKDLLETFVTECNDTKCRSLRKRVLSIIEKEIYSNGLPISIKGTLITRDTYQFMTKGEELITKFKEG